MKITLVSSTGLEDYLRMPHGFMPGIRHGAADTLAEFAGRACYQSWDKPNPATATNAGYLANVVEHEHYSVLEHASMTLYVEGVSRNMTHELVRHRHLSFSQLSQRFVDQSTPEYAVHPALRDSPSAARLARLAKEVHDYTEYVYREAVHILEAEGLARKPAREAARFYLSNDVATKIVVTGNIRAWRDFLGKRLTVHADAEIREFAVGVLEVLRDVAPNSVSDIKDYTA